MKSEATPVNCFKSIYLSNCKTMFEELGLVSVPNSRNGLETKYWAPIFWAWTKWGQLGEEGTWMVRLCVLGGLELGLSLSSHIQRQQYATQKPFDVPKCWWKQGGSVVRTFFASWLYRCVLGHSGAKVLASRGSSLQCTNLQWLLSPGQSLGCWS